ncbi:hypothetical protein [Streptomyces sp. NBC_00328]|uniref:hypothetical protein n=1 Tax=Streptomyces sp. NBC_00328 TaxID=2903646 RepID=UPI002E2E7374|nr:hypothetical protein [Streptomyces sp. NBC_00328]
MHAEALRVELRPAVVADSHAEARDAEFPAHTHGQFATVLINHVNLGVADRPADVEAGPRAFRDHA